MAYDYSNIPFTIVSDIDEKSTDMDKQHQWSKSWIMDRHGGIKIEVSNIKLKQAPQETLNMQVVIKRAKTMNGYSETQIWVEPNDYQQVVGYQSIYYYNCRIEMQFPNYLHEFNQDYSYEIVCKIIAKDKHSQHEYLFCCIESRLKGSISSHEKFSCVKYDLNHLFGNSITNLYFCIRRLNNYNSTLVDDEKIYKVISILRNTGYDVVLDAKDGRLSAHKAILSQNSEVFQAMFTVKMIESQSGIVNMLEFEARVVRKMLDYLYTRQLGELEDMTESLFKLAHRYQLHDLCRRCEEYYIFNVKVDNDSIFDILKLAEVYELEKLNECAMNFVNRHEHELIALKSYREYLIQSVTLENVVTLLLFAEKYCLEDVKIKIFDFIKSNYQQMMEDQKFLELFVSHGQLMQEIHIYFQK